MEDVAKHGRTVLFVSHNLAAIRQLCRGGVWLDGGMLKKIGSANEVVDAYSTAIHNGLTEGEFAPSLVKGDRSVQLISYRVTNHRGQALPLPNTNEDVLIHIRLHITEPIHQPACGISISNEYGVLITCVNTVEQGIILQSFPSGEMDVIARLRHVPFLPGSYMVSFWIMNPQGHIYAMAENAIVFEIGQSFLYGTSQLDHRWGCVYTEIDYTLKT
jgi:lipopolysaccharide transport system ATP-binding protein